MPRDPFIREKFTREQTAARKRAKEYFERYPKDRDLAQFAIGQYWGHDQAATRTDRAGLKGEEMRND
jgi:hypothetical protein